MLQKLSELMADPCPPNKVYLAFLFLVINLMIIYKITDDFYYLMAAFHCCLFSIFNCVFYLFFYRGSKE
jgi:hypothetical protein